MMISEEWNGKDIKENGGGLTYYANRLGFSEKSTQNISKDSQGPGYQSQQLKWTLPIYK